MSTQSRLGPEALSKGVYGMIVLTAGLTELRLHETPASQVIGAVVGTGLVLVVAHSYSEVLAEGFTTGSDRRRHAILRALWSNAPLVVGMIPALGLFALAAAGVLSLAGAYQSSTWWVLVMLFVFGAGAARAHGRRVATIMLAGVGASLLGTVVAGVELVLG